MEAGFCIKFIIYTLRRIVREKFSRRIVRAELSCAELSAPNCPAPNCPGTGFNTSFPLLHFQIYNDNCTIAILQLQITFYNYTNCHQLHAKICSAYRWRDSFIHSFILETYIAPLHETTTQRQYHKDNRSLPSNSNRLQYTLLNR